MTEALKKRTETCDLISFNVFLQPREAEIIIYHSFKITPTNCEIPFLFKF